MAWSALNSEGWVVLQKVVIQRFRSCTDLTIDNIGPSLVLVGRNGTGKTNILKAILWAATSALSNESLDAQVWEVHWKAVSLDFRIDDDLFRYAITVPPALRPPDSEISNWSIVLRESVSVLGPGGDWEEIVSRDGAKLRLPGRSPLTVPSSTPFLPLLFAYLPPNDGIIARLAPVKDFLGRIRYDPFDEPSESREPSDIIRETSYRGWLGKFDASGHPEVDSVLMKILHMWIAAPEDFKEVAAILGEDGFGLIDYMGVGTFEMPKGAGAAVPEKVYSVYFQPHLRGNAESDGGTNGPSRGFHFAELSLGTRRVIRIIVSMIFNKGSVMLIEHPEDGIHRGLTAKVFSTLRTYTDPSQIIVSSHSPLVFDMLDPEEIRLVSMHDGKTEARALTAEEADQARRYVRNQGTLTEYLDVLIEE